MFFSFDWQVELIISYLEDFFSSAIASFEPRDYRVVFVRQKKKAIRRSPSIIQLLLSVLDRADLDVTVALLEIEGAALNNVILALVGKCDLHTGLTLGDLICSLDL